MAAGPTPTTRVVFYTESTGRGGAEVALRNLLAELEPSIEAVVLAADAEVGAWIAAARPGTAAVRAVRVKGKFSLLSLLRLRRQVAALRPDVFHANLRTIGDARYGLLAACSLRGVRVVAVEQLPYPAASRLAVWLKRVTARRLAAHVAVGEAAARAVERLACLRAGSILAIYNGVPDRGALELPAGPGCVVGALARLDPIKGLDVLLEAAAGVPEVQLRIVGEGSSRPELEQLAERLGVAERVVFVPWRDDVQAELAAMHVLALPSRNEGFPLSIVEAMLAGRPVVATAVGSVPEAVDGDVGVLVPPDDVAALRDALRALSKDEPRRRALGEAARRRALDSFTAAAMARRFEALYRALRSG